MSGLLSCRKCFHALLLSSALTVAGCQSGPSGLSVGGGGVAVSGEVAQSRHEHVFDAIDALVPVLNKRDVNLSSIPLDASLSSLLPQQSASGLSRGESLSRLAESYIVESGPYEFVQSDARTGRLEFRSIQNDMHVAFLVRSPTATEQAKNLRFVITDAIAQTALSTLVIDSAKGGAEKVKARFLDESLNYARFANNSASEDAAILAHLNGLDKTEQNRDDLLGLRALLRLRMGHDELAKPLVEQGIIRYPNSPRYYALASVILQRADQYGDAEKALLDSIMSNRFSRAQVTKSRTSVAAFLAMEKLI